MKKTGRRQSKPAPAVDEAALPSFESTLDHHFVAQGMSPPVVRPFKRQRRRTPKGGATLEPFFAKDKAAPGGTQD